MGHAYSHSPSIAGGCLDSTMAERSNSEQDHPQCQTAATLPLTDKVRRPLDSLISQDHSYHYSENQERNCGGWEDRDPCGGHCHHLRITGYSGLHEGGGSGDRERMDSKVGPRDSVNVLDAGWKKGRTMTAILFPA